MAAHDHEKHADPPKVAAPQPVLHDDAPAAPHADEQHAPAHPVTIDPRALLPWVLPDLAPHAPTQDDAKTAATRVEAERLLKSKGLQNEDDASKGVDVLLDAPAGQRAQLIDHLDPKAFENLLDRVPVGEREKIEALVDASQDPKRKLQMWAMVHKARASNDLQKYKGDFGEPGDQSKEQKHAQQAFERRDGGVESDAVEVDRDVARLMAKADKGQLTIREVDELRERKDLELKIEMTYNTNLLAEKGARDNGDQVVWSKQDLQQMQTLLSEIPPEQLKDSRMAERFVRRASRTGFEPKAEYKPGDHAIDVYDGAETHQHDAQEVPGRSIVSDEFRKQHGDTPDAFEYTVTHEIGHNISDEKKKAFAKFSAVGHHEDNLNTDQLHAMGLSDEEIQHVDAIRRQAVPEMSVQHGDKLFTPGNHPNKGQYAAVDKAAIPDSPHMTYAAMNAQEHFAEMYAQGVLSPEALYEDYVANPTRAADKARAEVKQEREMIAAIARNPVLPDIMMTMEKQKLAADEAAVKQAELAQREQGQEFAIMRNDVFGTDKAQAAAERHLIGAGVAPEKIAEFRNQAAHAVTPQQIEELESEAKKRR